VNGSCQFSADSQPKLIGGPALSLHSSNSRNDFGHDHSTTNIVVAIIIIIVIIK